MVVLLFLFLQKIFNFLVGKAYCGLCMSIWKLFFLILLYLLHLAIETLFNCGFFAINLSIKELYSFFIHFSIIDILNSCVFRSTFKCQKMILVNNVSFLHFVSMNISYKYDKILRKIPIRTYLMHFEVKKTFFYFEKKNCFNFFFSVLSTFNECRYDNCITFIDTFRLSILNFVFRISISFSTRFFVCNFIVVLKSWTTRNINRFFFERPNVRIPNKQSACEITVFFKCINYLLV